MKKISTRLIVGFGAVLSLMVILSTANIVKMRNTASLMDSVVHEGIDRERKMAQWHTLVQMNGQRTIAVLKSETASTAGYFQAEMKKASGKVNELQKDLEATASNASKAKFEQLAAARAVYAKEREAVFEKNNLGTMTPADFQSIVGLMNNYLASINDLTEAEKEAMNASVRAIERQFAENEMIIIISTLIALISGITLAYYISRSITSPLNTAIEFANKVAANDLSAPMVHTRTDEMGTLLTTLDDMRNSLKSIVSEVSESAGAISVASQQIAAGSVDLSGRTEQQAASLEEAAASMEEFGASIKQNTQSAATANTLSAEVRAASEDCATAVSGVVSVMNEITQSAGKISEITALMDSIAFQTNILALNAAIEAARAGDAGRGFAVVAKEVRALSQRSATASADIKKLIEKSVSDTKAGNLGVQGAQEKITQLSGAVESITTLIADIAEVSREQSSTIQQINESVAQLDNATQQNAALVEENSAASESLNEQARKLVEKVRVFIL